MTPTRRWAVIGGPSGHLNIVPITNLDDTRWRRWTVLATIRRPRGWRPPPRPQLYRIYDAVLRVWELV